MTQPDDHAQKEYIAQTRLDEVVYELLQLGWSDDDILEKVYSTLEQFREGGEDESQSQR